LGRRTEQQIKIKIRHGLKRPPYDKYTQQTTKKRPIVWGGELSNEKNKNTAWP
jgi:hypothetical protein